MFVFGRVRYNQIKTNISTSTTMSGCFEVLFVYLTPCECSISTWSSPAQTVVTARTFTVSRLTVTMWRSTEQQILVCRKLQAMVAPKGRSSTLCHFRNDTPPLIFPLSWKSDGLVAQSKLKKRMGGSGGTWWDKTMTTAVQGPTKVTGPLPISAVCYAIAGLPAEATYPLSTGAARILSDSAVPTVLASEVCLSPLCHHSPWHIPGSPAQSSWPNPNHRERKVATT